METKPALPATNATPKHVFLHLLMIAMLYISVVAIITLAFQYINHIFFDPAFSQRLSIFSGIRWSSSALIVAFPVLVYISYLLGKDMRATPALRFMKTRRWLLYFTQFATALTIIIDLMVLIYEFYGGEITPRFILKVVVVLIVAAIVLGYYRWELHRETEESNIPKIAAIVIGVALVASIVSGFFIAGTPAEQRAVRLDEQRINDLWSVQSSILSFAQTKATLPKTMETLTAWSGELPNDPDTDQAYVYTKTSATTFELCATFGSDQTTEESLSYYGTTYPEKIGLVSTQLVGGSSWKHPEGYYCFPREVEFAAAQ